MPIDIEILQINQEWHDSFVIDRLQLNDCLAVWLTLRFRSDEGLAVETSKDHRGYLKTV